MSIDLEFISLGCNKVANCLDRLKTKQLAFGLEEEDEWLVGFGANDQIGLAVMGGKREYNYLPKQPMVMLKGHGGRVNALRFIYDHQGNPIGILSGSSNGQALIWCYNSDTHKWYIHTQLKPHQGSITTVCCDQLQLDYTNLNHDITLITSGTDGQSFIYKWNPKSNDDGILSLDPTQTLIHKSSYILCSEYTYLPNSINGMLILAGTDKNIHIYIESDQFKSILKLAGHEDWVRGISLVKKLDESNQISLFLASGSQDRYIRLWNFSLATTSISTSDTMPQLSTQTHQLTISNPQGDDIIWNISLESVLMGHDDWVHSVQWYPSIPTKDTELRLLSASADKSLMVWSPDIDTGIWNNDCQLGEIGGNTLGFYAGQFCPLGKSIIAIGYHGALHSWINQEQIDKKLWEARPCASGHYGEVKSISWDPETPYFVTTGLDQTTRGFGQLEYSKQSNKYSYLWGELARPQIHGYDLRQVQFVSPYQFASCSDEKVIRIFDAPKSFLQNASKILGTQFPSHHLDSIEQRPLGANLPALGLSNKAVGKQEDDLDNSLNMMAYPGYSDNINSKQVNDLTLEENNNSKVELPYEEDLLQTTLWPEVEKLYGHGYEVVALASSQDQSILASSCKASVPNHAVIRLFDTKTYKEILPPLPGHQLTVTTLDFSTNSQYLLSGSRDRSLTLFKRSKEGFVNLNQILKAHSRIVWCVKFVPNQSNDSMEYFLSGSRDKTIKVWQLDQNDNITNLSTISFESPVTALDVIQLSPNLNLLAVGLESGQIILLKGSKADWNIIAEVKSEDCSSKSITMLKFQPNHPNRFVSVSDDHSIRVFQFKHC